MVFYFWEKQIFVMAMIINYDIPFRLVKARRNPFWYLLREDNIELTVL